RRGRGVENAGVAVGEAFQCLAFFGVHHVGGLRSHQSPLLPEFRGGPGAQLERRSGLAPARRERAAALARAGELPGADAGGKNPGRSRGVHHQDAAAVSAGITARTDTSPVAAARPPAPCPAPPPSGPPPPNAAP